MIQEWFAARKARQQESRLNKTRRALVDAVHKKNNWGFADTPSEREDRLEDIYRLIRHYEELGGDVLTELSYSDRYLAMDAMPEVFEKDPQGLDYKATRRIEQA